jgi:branched-chain amino acid transport system substrate-binding protein
VEQRRGIMKSLGVMKRLYVFVALGVIGGIIFTSASTARAQNPINICFTTDFSGVTASFGITEAPVVEMVVKEVNAAGGINGRPIKLFPVLDNAADPTKTVGNLKMFKELNKCVAIVQGVTSSTSIAAKAWAEQNHIPIIAPDPATDQLVQTEGKSWLFRTEVPISVRMLTALPRLKELGHDKVSFEGSTLAWGTDALKSLKEHAPKYGVKVVGEVLAEPKTKDLTIQAMRLRDAGAQAVVTAEYEAETGVWARALNSIRWKPYMFHGSASVFATTLRTNPPELFEGWETAQTIDVSKPLVKQAWDKYEAYTGKRVEDEKVPRTWDAIHLLIEAIKLSGNPDDPEAIRDGFYKIKNLPLAVGRKETRGSFEIGRNHLLTDKDMVVYVVRSGKLVPIR